MDGMAEWRNDDLSVEERKRILDVSVYVALSDRWFEGEAEVLETQCQLLALEEDYLEKRVYLARRGKLEVSIPKSVQGREVSLRFITQVITTDRLIELDELYTMYEIGMLYELGWEDVTRLLKQYIPGLNEKLLGAVKLKWEKEQRRGELVKRKREEAGKGDAEGKREVPQVDTISGRLGEVGWRGLAGLLDRLGGSVLAPPPGVTAYASGKRLIWANMVPLLGVIFFEWSFALILWSYWWENLVILMFTVVKYFKSRRYGEQMGLGYLFGYVLFFGLVNIPFALMIQSFVNKTKPYAEKIMSRVGDDVETMMMFPEAIMRGFADYPVSLPLVIMSMFLLHGLSYVEVYRGGGEYARERRQQFYVIPFFRLLTLTIGYLIASLVYAFHHNASLFLIVLIVLKTGFEYLHYKWAYRGIHERAKEWNRVVMCGMEDE